MCGLVGLLSAQSRSPAELEAVASRMAGTIVHRGPDDSGTWVSLDSRAALGFRRLSILDLSAAGHQPMASASGRYTVAFNGELYNHRDLRKELGDAPWRGHSDTETLLAGFERWGVASTIRRVAGMFAIAVWDSERNELSLARDRLGKKPLYLLRHGGLLAFASELHAFREVPAFVPTVDPDALACYLRFLYVPAPQSIFREVRKLRPGHLLTLRSPADPIDGESYWTPVEAAARGKAAPFRGDATSAVEALDELLTDATAGRLLSDVPVGALLSGGIDSSLVVGLMTEVAAGSVRTYSVSFPGSGFDESSHALAAARHFATSHTTFDLSDADLLGVVPRLATLFDEPNADPSCVPTYLISALARRDVTVALTGDGGDEMFGGYNRYARGGPLLRTAMRVPAPLRRLLGAGGGWREGVVQRLGGGGTQQSGRARDGRLRRVLAARSAGAMYEQLVSTTASATALVPGSAPAHLAYAALLDDPGMPVEERMMLVDQLLYLPDDLLAKLDRASMAASLEARSPLLDHRVCEFAWSLPLEMKIRRGTTKWILRRLLERRLPREVFERPKMGFSSPIAMWLRGPLRPWADGLLQQAGGVLDATAVRAVWSGFLAGAEEAAPLVWALAVYRDWERRWFPNGTSISA